MVTTSSPSNLDSINLEDENIAYASIIVLERPLGRKAEKAQLNKQKSNEGTSSNVEVTLNVMVEKKKKKYNVTRMEFHERVVLHTLSRRISIFVLRKKKFNWQN